MSYLLVLLLLHFELYGEHLSRDRETLKEKINSSDSI